MTIFSCIWHEHDILFEYNRHKQNYTSQYNITKYKFHHVAKIRKIFQLTNFLMKN
jgi:hypothetical protein